MLPVARLKNYLYASMLLGSPTLLHPGVLCDRAGLASGMRVADFGCGAHGWLVHHALERVGTDGRVYAVDVRPEVLSLLLGSYRPESIGAPETIWADIEQYGGTSIPHASLDRIFMVNVVSELEDITAALREGERLLAPDGKIVVVDWGRAEHPLAPRMLVPPEQVVRAIDDTGLLMAADMFSAGPHHYGIIIDRT